MPMYEIFLPVYVPERRIEFRNALVVVCCGGTKVPVENGDVYHVCLLRSKEKR